MNESLRSVINKARNSPVEQCKVMTNMLWTASILQLHAHLQCFRLFFFFRICYFWKNRKALSTSSLAFCIPVQGRIVTMKCSVMVGIVTVCLNYRAGE